MAARAKKLRALLDALYERRLALIEGGVPKSYQIGSRSKVNYDMPLPDLERAIGRYEDELAQLEDALDGVSRTWVTRPVAR